VVGYLKWGLRSALAVGFSAFLVMNGHFQARVHGFGILVLITCINCSEQLQGDLLRKSLERLLGTSIGSLGAMCVLYVDDFFVPEACGWSAREFFYLAVIGAFTMGGVVLRARNHMRPLYDHSYFLSVASFDFLLLDLYKHAHQFLDGMYSILMVVVGGFFTVVMGLLCFPQYAGDELARLTAESLEVTATELEDALIILTACDAFEMDRQDIPSPGRCLREVQRMKQLASLALFEVRFFPPRRPYDKWPRLLNATATVDWTACLRTAEAAAAVCEVCDSVWNICEADDAVWENPSVSSSVGSFEAHSPCPCEAEVLAVLRDAIETVMYCAKALRLKTCEPDRPSLAPPELCEGCGDGRRFQEALLHRYGVFHDSCVRLEGALSAERERWPHSLKYAAVRMLSVQLPARMFACVSSAMTLAEEGILLPSVPGAYCKLVRAK